MSTVTGMGRLRASILGTVVSPVKSANSHRDGGTAGVKIVNGHRGWDVSDNWRERRKRREDRGTGGERGDEQRGGGVESGEVKRTGRREERDGTEGRGEEKGDRKRERREERSKESRWREERRGPEWS